VHKEAKEFLELLFSDNQSLDEHTFTTETVTTLNELEGRSDESVQIYELTPWKVLQNVKNCSFRAYIMCKVAECAFKFRFTKVIEPGKVGANVTIA